MKYMNVFSHFPKYFILLLFFSFFKSTNLNAQISEWSKTPSVGAYYTSFPFNRYEGRRNLNVSEKYFSNTLNVALTLPLTKHLRLGTHFMLISNKVVRQPIDRAFATGIFAQLGFPVGEVTVYLESGYAISNLCSCGNAEMYSSDSLNHRLQTGIGVSYGLSKRLYLKAGLTNYWPIGKEKPSDVHNWAQPFIGLNYHFYKKYTTPFKLRSKKKPRTSSPASSFPLLWEDDKIRRWTLGLTSAGTIFGIQNQVAQQIGLLLRYREFVITPRINYWVNQAVLLGVQGTYYHYENTQDTIANQSGFGTGLQARFYPLSFKNPTKFKAVRLDETGDLNIAPVVGVELRVSNFSWEAPAVTGERWRYFEVQPYAGFVLSYKRWLNVFWQIGPTLGVNDPNIATPVNGTRVIGFEYNLTR